MLITVDQISVLRRGSKMRFDVLIVPTAGLTHDCNGATIPTERGILRINTAVRLVKSGEVDLLLFLGGKRDSLDEAFYYRMYAILHASCPPIAKKEHEAPANCTNRDLSGSVSLPKYAQNKGIERGQIRIGFDSYKEHAERAEEVLSWLGYHQFEWVDSGEGPGYSERVERILSSVTKIDHGFRTFGLPLVWLSSLRSRLN